MKQFMNGDFEGDTSVLFEANFMPTSTRSVRDDCVTSAITRDDVQVVCFSIAFDKSFTKIKFHSVWSFNYQTRPFLKKTHLSPIDHWMPLFTSQLTHLMQLFSWMCSIPLAIAARSDEVKAASIV